MVEVSDEAVEAALAEAARLDYSGITRKSVQALVAAAAPYIAAKALRDAAPRWISDRSGLARRPRRRHRAGRTGGREGQDRARRQRARRGTDPRAGVPSGHARKLRAFGDSDG